MTDDASVAGEPDTRALDNLLDDVFRAQERVDQGEIYRHAVAAGLPADLLARVDALPEGEYSVDEASDLLGGSVG
ncbi:hypothetical protein [Micromonospora sp. WMMD964]|uniref:hypothetical protein n=1 Tax=Micromonospora sp. WMMD964 TaxID=3016091 RepID=UPI00249BB5D3|nr:hypothetical protein [Micromonospora sp. WMMD964]WFF01074.1 hypothetical protein O7616_30300 [Micromonospora sp. WMMD964]